MTFHISLLVIFSSFSAFGMIKALNTAATGMAAQESLVNTISNNIANVNTMGFKRQRAEFEDLKYRTIQEAGARSSNETHYNVGTQIGSGAKLSAVRKEFTMGDPTITNNTFDIMIQGDGFFGVMMANGDVQYTRDGSFNVDNTGTLVTKSGLKVSPGLNFPPGTMNVHIAANGKVEAYLKDQVEPVEVGQMPVFLFINPVGLTNVGGNKYRASRSSGQPIQQNPGDNNAGPLLQGALETSNVSIMTEMTGLIRAQRAYEMNSKVMTTADQMLQTINNIR